MDIHFILAGIDRNLLRVPAPVSNNHRSTVVEYRFSHFDNIVFRFVGTVSYLRVRELSFFTRDPKVAVTNNFYHGYGYGVMRVYLP